MSQMILALMTSIRPVSYAVKHASVTDTRGSGGVVIFAQLYCVDVSC